MKYFAERSRLVANFRETRPNEFESMTARKGDIIPQYDIATQYHKRPLKPCKAIQGHVKPCKPMQGHARPCKTMQGHTRPHSAIQYHNVPQMITLCPYRAFMNLMFVSVKKVYKSSNKATKAIKSHKAIQGHT